MDYRTYLASEQWQIVRHEALVRARHQCALCPENRSLEVHHRTYARIGHERPEDLVVLCFWCHRRHHDTLVTARRGTSAQQLALPFPALRPTGPELN